MQFLVVANWSTVCHKSAVVFIFGDKTIPTIFSPYNFVTFVLLNPDKVWFRIHIWGIFTQVLIDELTIIIYIISNWILDMSQNVSNKSRGPLRELYFRLFTSGFNKNIFFVKRSRFWLEICLNQTLYQKDKNEYQILFLNSLLSPTTLITVCSLIVDKEIWKYSDRVLPFWDKTILCIFCKEH